MLLRKQARVRPPGTPFFSGRTSRPSLPKQPAMELLITKTTSITAKFRFAMTFTPEPSLLNICLPVIGNVNRREELPGAGSRSELSPCKMFPLAQGKNGVNDGCVDLNQRHPNQRVKDVHALMVNDVHHLLKVKGSICAGRNGIDGPRGMNAFTHGLTGTLQMLVQRRHQLIEMFLEDQ